MTAPLTADSIEAAREMLILPPPFTVQEREFMTEQIRFPRTKKRRIRKKWKQRQTNFGPSRTVIYQPESHTFFLHPKTRARFFQQLTSKKSGPLRIVKLPVFEDLLAAMPDPEPPPVRQSQWFTALSWSSPVIKPSISPIITLCHA